MSQEHSPLIRSLRAAVAAAPDDLALRLHLAEQLVAKAQQDAAISEIAAVLHRDPGNTQALAMMASLNTPATESTPDEPEPHHGPAEPKEQPEFDWARAESELNTPQPDDPVAADALQPDTEIADEPEIVTTTLADVAGMQEVKKRLNAAFLAPMANPKLRKMYHKSLRGGLLLYGPPGCGKTYVAKAVAGELGANFINVTLNDVLDKWLGNSEANLHKVFANARSKAPCVLFFDELDAIGAKRDQIRHGGMRNIVNQLLGEMDGVESDNEGVYLLAATNFPWDVDTALRRPGRFDRTVLVTPPDRQARSRVLELNLAERPVARVDLPTIAKRTEGFSGADLAHLCELATERALMDSVESGVPRRIGQADLVSALEDMRPSCAPWFATARNVALFSNEDGSYDDLVKYLKKHHKW